MMAAIEKSNDGVRKKIRTRSSKTMMARNNRQLGDVIPIVSFLNRLLGNGSKKLHLFSRNSAIGFSNAKIPLLYNLFRCPKTPHRLVIA
jgi:hypothetical protein